MGSYGFLDRTSLGWHEGDLSRMPIRRRDEYRT